MLVDEVRQRSQLGLLAMRTVRAGLQYSSGAGGMTNYS
jgi:hypothetical protein